MNDDLQQPDQPEEELDQVVASEDTIATPEEEVAEAEVEAEVEDKGELAEVEDMEAAGEFSESLEPTTPVAEPIEELEEEIEELSDEDITPVADTAASLSQKWPGQWYVLHTYSGYEDAVSDSLKQRISSLDMQDKIFDVLVPKENQIEIKNGKRKIVEKKMFPGYVLVNMNVTEDSWYVVRNTPNVTGFIGSGTVPVPVAEHELKGIFKRMDVEEPKYKIDVNIGDLVHIKDGPFKNYDGSVAEIDEEKGKIKVLVSIFGRETPVELDFLQIKKA
jgi:transcriptional antiterminator NusG